MQTLTIPRPDDFHVHFRDGAAMQSVVPHTARQFARALVMPNLKPPVVAVEQALAYKKQIEAAVPQGCAFVPLMSLYLTDRTLPDTVRRAKAAGIAAFKLYPAGATTNSDSGVTDLFKLMPVLEEIAAQDLRLLVHGETTDPDIDIFDREAVFIERTLLPLMARLPELKIVFEHITTAEAAALVSGSGENLAATITPQHLMYNRNHILVGGVRPHFYCLPVIKRERHRQALLAAATGEKSHKFFLGTDSAPHPQQAKESACGCAGMFSAANALGLYAQIFEQAGALDKLAEFAARNGARFYGLPENNGTVTLVKRPQRVPESFEFGADRVIPMCAGEEISWQLAD